MDYKLLSNDDNYQLLLHDKLHIILTSNGTCKTFHDTIREYGIFEGESY